MAPSVTFGDSSLPEGAEGNGGGYNTAGGAARVPRSEPASFGGSEHAPPLRAAAASLPPSGREVPNECEAEGACGWWDCILNFIRS